MNWIGLFLAAAGAFSVACSAMDWDFFMNSRKARFFVNLLGRNGARAFYAALGMVLIVLGLLIFAGIVEDVRQGFRLRAQV